MSKKVNDEVEFKEVLPEPPEVRLQKLEAEKTELERELQKERDEALMKLQQEENQKRLEKVEAEERRMENGVMFDVAPVVDRLKADAGDLISDPDFLLGLFAVTLVYGRETWLSNQYEHMKIARYIRAYKRSKS
jgi:hypothetical protein